MLICIDGRTMKILARNGYLNIRSNVRLYIVRKEGGGVGGGGGWWLGRTDWNPYTATLQREKSGCFRFEGEGDS